jgi:hypothetical protein
MKMKEKKTEEVVEKVVETPKISDEVREFLETHRQFMHQYFAFKHMVGLTAEKLNDKMYEEFGLDISKPVSVLTGFSKETRLEQFEKFMKSMINLYNEFDFNKLENYTRIRIERAFPDGFKVEYVKRCFKKCAQHTTEE